MPSTMEIEGYEVGGKVAIVKKDKVEFFRDVLSYYQMPAVILLCHVIYFTTGDFLIVTLLALHMDTIGYLLQTDKNEDRENLSKKSEKEFQDDWKFVVPLYLTMFLEFTHWVWALVVLSDAVTIDHWLFATKPQNWF